MRNRHSERGTTMVETALVMGVLLLVLFGIMDFGRAMYTYHLVGNAARLGSRFAIVHGWGCQHFVSGGNDTWPCQAPATEIANYVSQQSIAMGLGPIPTTDVTTNWSFVEGCNGGSRTLPAGATVYNQTGCQVAVTVAYTYSFVLPFMPGTSIPLKSTSTMLISQ